MATVQRTFAFAADAEGMVDQAVSGVAFAFEGADGNPAGSVKFTFGSKGSTATERGATSGLTWQDYGVPAGATVNSVRVVSYSRKVAVNSKLSAHSHLIRVGGYQCASESLPTATGGWLVGGGIAAAGAPLSGADLEIEYTVTTLGGGGSASVDARFDQIVVEVDYSTTEAKSGSFTVSHPHSTADDGVKSAQGAVAIAHGHEAASAGRKAATGIVDVTHAHATSEGGAKAVGDTFTSSHAHTVSLVGGGAAAEEGSGSFTETHSSATSATGAKAIEAGFDVTHANEVGTAGARLASGSTTVELGHAVAATGTGRRGGGMSVAHGHVAATAGGSKTVTGVFAVEMSLVVLTAGMNPEAIDIIHPLVATVERQPRIGATTTVRAKPHAFREKQA